MLSCSEVTHFMSLPKRAVSAMEWRQGITSRNDAQWWKWDCAIEVEGRVPESARIVMQWRPAVGAAAEKIYCALLYRTNRIYAVDFDPDGRHTNKIGKGRKYFRVTIGPGTHEHFWTEQGDGYAEPIQPDFASLSLLFEYFCKGANLSVDGGFLAPPSVQLDLGI